MKRWMLTVSILLMVSSAYAIDNEETFADPALLVRYQHLTGELRCPKCQNETIADSDAPVAADLRRELREMLVAGKSDDDIIKFLTDRYGDFVLYNPPFVARTWLLWAMPGILLVGALSIAIVVIRHRAQMPIDSSDESDTGNAAQ